MIEYNECKLTVDISSDVRETISNTIIRPILNSSETKCLRTGSTKPSVEHFLEYFLERVVTEELEYETFHEEFGESYIRNWF
ncbi:hypothetical protein AB8879_06605 [Alphaproteobacteria bacterium LSUCC0744]|jgi:hypothetical protein